MFSVHCIVYAVPSMPAVDQCNSTLYIILYSVTVDSVKYSSVKVPSTLYGRRAVEYMNSDAAMYPDPGTQGAPL